MKIAAPQHVCRTSISLPESVLRQLDRLAAERGFESRSQRWGNLNLASPIMPPLHPFAGGKREEGSDQ